MTMISARLALFRWVCPLIARKDGNTNDMCSGCGCPVWRFWEQPADPDAMRAVGDERLGWCGLGGKPEVES